MYPSYKSKEWEDDGWGDYQHGKAFTAAYEMADRVPVSRSWANALTELYAELPTAIHGVQRNIDTTRWVATDLEDREAERTANAEGRLSNFQSVRFFCTLAGLKGDEGRISYLLGSSDIAERSAAYSCGKFPAWKVWWFLRKDGAFAFGQFLQNDDIWESRQKRKIIDRYYMNNATDLLKCEFNYGEILEKRMREFPQYFSQTELDAYKMTYGNKKIEKIERINKILLMFIVILSAFLLRSI